MKITHVIADTGADAIKAVCYVRGFRHVRQLAELMAGPGKASRVESYLAKILNPNGKVKGSEAFRLRVLAHMPEGVVVDEEEAT